MLLDRLTERAALGQLLLVHGQAWVGKTALLEDTMPPSQQREELSITA